MLEGLARRTVSCTTVIYFGGVRHEGPGMVRLSNPAGNPLVLLNSQRNPADVTGFSCAEPALSNYPV